MSLPTRPIIQVAQPSAPRNYPAPEQIVTIDTAGYIIGPYKQSAHPDGFNYLEFDLAELKTLISSLGFALASSSGTAPATTPTVYVTATQALTQQDTYSGNQLNLNSAQNSIRIKAVIDPSQTGYTNAHWVKLSGPAGDTSKFGNNDPTVLDTYVIDMIAGNYQFRFEFIDSGGMGRQGPILATTVAPPATTTPPATSGTSVANTNFKMDVFGRRDQQATSTEVASPLTIFSNEDAAKIRIVLSNAATVNGSAGPVKVNYSFPSANGPEFDRFGPVAEQTNLLEVTPLYLPVGNTRVRIMATDAANTVVTFDFIVTRASS